MTFALRVATFNAGLHPDWFHHTDERAELLVEALAGLEADVVALQEVWTGPFRDRISVGWPGVAVAADPMPPDDRPWAAEGATGIMLLTRRQPDEIRVVELDGTLMRRAVIAVRIGPVVILTTHLAAYLRHAEHPDPAGWPGENLAQGRRILELTAEVSGPVVLAGDLNCGPSGPGLVAEMDASYQAIRSGFDTNPYLEQSAPPCTWCPDNPMVTVGDHGVIDHVMARGLRPAGTRRIFDEPVILPNGSATPLSDHYGVLAEFLI